LHEVKLEPANQHKNWQSVGISVLLMNEVQVERFFVSIAKKAKIWQLC
jgi:hypothetical protein